MITTSWWWRTLARTSSWAPPRWSSNRSSSTPLARSVINAWNLHKLSVFKAYFFNDLTSVLFFNVCDFSFFFINVYNLCNVFHFTYLFTGCQHYAYLLVFVFIIVIILTRIFPLFFLCKSSYLPIHNLPQLSLYQSSIYAPTSLIPLNLLGAIQHIHPTLLASC